MSTVLEVALVINSLLVSGLLFGKLILLKKEIEQQREEEYRRNIVAIEGLADLYSLEDE